jgi:hypothetical protein
MIWPLTVLFLAVIIAGVTTMVIRMAIGEKGKITPKMFWSTYAVVAIIILVTIIIPPLVSS